MLHLGQIVLQVLMSSSEPTLVTVVTIVKLIKPKVKIAANQVILTTGSFLINLSFQSFSIEPRNYFCLFSSFPARKPKCTKL